MPPSLEGDWDAYSGFGDNDGFGGGAGRGADHNPRYPVCLQNYHAGGGNIDCCFTSLEQCYATAQGRGGSCFNNPYFAGAPSAGGRRFSGGDAIFKQLVVMAGFSSGHDEL